MNDDDVELTALDTRDYALIITIGMDGFADVKSANVDRDEAARLLRILADRFAGYPANATAAGGERDDDHPPPPPQ